MEQDELAARQEIEDLDALIKEAGQTIKKLNERRRQVLPVAERTIRGIAALLHADQCKSDHGSGPGLCKWELSRGSWSNDAHKEWLDRAKLRVRDSKASESEILAALKVITPEFRVNYAEDDVKASNW